MTSEEASTTDLTKAKKSGKLSTVTTLFTKYFSFGSSNKKDKDAAIKVGQLDKRSFQQITPVFTAQKHAIALLLSNSRL